MLILNSESSCQRHQIELICSAAALGPVGVPKAGGHTVTVAPHAFVSYVHEDKEIVERLCSELREKGVALWLDREKILAGEPWRVAIRKAIRDGTFFIACLSQSSQSKRRSYMNEELVLAIEEIRLRPAERIWFIPVLLEPIEIPELEIGGGRTLSSLNYIALYENWNEGVESLLKVLAPPKTTLEHLRDSLQVLVNDLLIQKRPTIPVLQNGDSHHTIGSLWTSSVWALTIRVRNTSNEVLSVNQDGLSLVLPNFLDVRNDDFVGYTQTEDQIEYQLSLEAPIFPGAERVRPVRFLSRKSPVTFNVSLKLGTGSEALEYTFSLELVGSNTAFIGH